MSIFTKKAKLFQPFLVHHEVRISIPSNRRSLILSRAEYRVDLTFVATADL